MLITHIQSATLSFGFFLLRIRARTSKPTAVDSAPDAEGIAQSYQDPCKDHSDGRVHKKLNPGTAEGREKQR